MKEKILYGLTFAAMGLVLFRGGIELLSLIEKIVDDSFLMGCFSFLWLFLAPLLTFLITDCLFRYIKSRS